VLTLAQAAEQISSLIEYSGFSSESFAVSVVPLPRGRSLFGFNATRSMIPASNAKLVTSAAALSILGPKYRFKTEFRFHKGSLYIKGYGDPTLQVLHLKEMARMVLADKQAKDFSGTVYLDAGFFNEYESIHDGFRRSGNYNTALGPLSVEHNRVVSYLFRDRGALPAKQVFQARVTPDPEGFDVVVSTDPPLFATHHKPQYRVDWDPDAGRHRITVTPPLEPDRESLAIRRPTEHFSRVFAHVARDAGLDVRTVGRGEAPEGAVLLFSYVSQPLYEILRWMNRTSDNFVAEQLLLHMAGREGKTTREDGLAIIERFLVRDVGMVKGSFVLENASGLSRRSRFSPAQLTKLLSYMRRQDALAPTFESSLPIAGWSGTLRRRLLDPPALLSVAAKTGMIDYANSVSGYGRGAGGTQFAFSIMCNDMDGLGAGELLTPLERESEDEWRKTTDINNRFKAAQDRILDILTRTRFD